MEDEQIGQTASQDMRLCFLGGHSRTLTLQSVGVVPRWLPSLASLVFTLLHLQLTQLQQFSE